MNLGSNIASPESEVNIRIRKGMDCYWLYNIQAEIWSLMK